MMKYAKRKLWKDGIRCLCEFEEDGSVTFKDDITNEELKHLVCELLREAEVKRQQRIEFKCPSCRCQPGCVCCRDGFCGCKENQVKLEETSAQWF